MYAPNSNVLKQAYERIVRFCEESGIWAPSQESISKALSVAFWASLQSDEGRATLARISMVESESLQAEASGEDVRFLTPTVLDADGVSKIAAALPRGWDILYSVSTNKMFGMCRSSFEVVRVVAASPGVVVLRWWENTLAVFKGERAIVPLVRGHVVKDLAAFFTDDALRRYKVDALFRIVATMRSLHHGGTMLLVPEGGDDWRGCVDVPPFSAAEPLAILRDACIQYASVDPGGRQNGGYPTDYTQVLQGKLEPHHYVFGRATRIVASFANLDGALVISSDMSLLSYGAKIKVSLPEDTRVLYYDAESGGMTQSRTLGQLGGTRHQSAARFVHANRGCVAVVVSQDGHTSLMTGDATWGVEVTRGLEYV